MTDIATTTMPTGRMINGMTGDTELLLYARESRAMNRATACVNRLMKPSPNTTAASATALKWGHPYATTTALQP